jgi:hypothetical protein
LERDQQSLARFNSGYAQNVLIFNVSAGLSLVGQASGKL